MKPSPRMRKPNGFSVLALAILMTALGLALVLVLALLPNQSDQARIVETIATLGDAQDALLSFVVKNSRLPAPDSNNDGLEDAAATFGALPYRDMGLPAPVVDEASIPLRYAPYRNAPLADLAALTSLYTPDVPDGTSFGCAANPASPVNLLDFCTGLASALTASSSTAFVNTGPAGNNVAFAVLSGGVGDADGNGADASLDGPNDDGVVTYEDPARGRSLGYDDIVRVKPFAALQRELSCTPLLGSMNLMASTAQESKGVADAAQSQLDAANIQLVIDSIAELLRAVILADALASAVGAALTTTDVCAVAAACSGPCVQLNKACSDAGAAAVSATAVATTAGVDLAPGAIVLSVAIALRDEVEVLRNAANSHLCSVITEVHAADQRGGLR